MSTSPLRRLKDRAFASLHRLGSPTNNPAASDTCGRQLKDPPADPAVLPPFRRANQRLNSPGRRRRDLLGSAPSSPSRDHHHVVGGLASDPAHLPRERRGTMWTGPPVEIVDGRRVKATSARSSCPPSPAGGDPVHRHQQAHAGAVSSVALSEDGQVALSCGADDTLCIWNPRSKPGHLRRIPDARATRVAVSRDGSTAVTCGGTSVGLWRLPAGEFVRHLDFVAPVAHVAVSTDGRMLAVSSGDLVFLWNVPLGAAKFKLPEPRAGPVALSTEGRRVAVAGGDPGVRVYLLDSGTVYRTLKASTAPILSVAMDPPGDFAAAGSGDHSAFVWRLADGSLLYRLQDHTGPVHSVAFSPDSALLATASEDGQVVLWRHPTGQRHQGAVHHPAGLRAVALGPAGLGVAGGADGTWHVWRAAADDAQA